MKPSPLILQDYFLVEESLSVNKAYDAQKPLELCMDDLRINRELQRREGEGDRWVMTLKIQLQASPEKNTPYAFSLELVGMLEVVAGFPEDRKQQLLEVNGASMLYGAAREIVRAMTARGPYFQTVLPSVSFYPVKENPPAAEPEKKEDS